MAEFSKQYCEKDDRDFAWDFDILDVAENIPVEHCLPYICEGYGFIAIGRNASSDIELAFRDENGEVYWKPYHEVVVQ